MPIEAKLPKPADQNFKKKSEEALELVNESCKELFTDQYQRAFAVVAVNAHAETIAIASNNFKHWIARQYYTEKQGTMSSEDISSVLNTLTGRALFDGPRRHIDLRVASMDDAIYYDLTSKTWRAVKITKDGWSIAQAPVLFARYNNQLPQREPIRDYPSDILNQFIALTNIAVEEHKLLLKVYLVALFLPDISKPVLITHGEQGSAKTFLQRLVKLSVDPSEADTLAIPKSPAELIQQLSHNYVALYDNLSALDDWASDLFCKAVTGSGASKRLLYSNDDDMIYSFKRCVMLNGINVVARKADLLDRALMVQLERIPREKRRKESELLAELDRIKPAVLGYIMDILVQVLKRKGEVRLAEYPRLADFAEYGELIARCMGYPEGRFTEAYFNNQKLQTVEALEAQPIGTAVMKFMESLDKWGPGALSELLEQLEGTAAKLKLNTKSRTWPKAPHVLSRRLNEVKTNLREVGIIVELDTDSRTNTRVVSIRKKAPIPPVASDVQNHAQNTLESTGAIIGDTGDTSRSSSGQS
jgi:hypothetical protein